MSPLLREYLPRRRRAKILIQPFQGYYQLNAQPTSRALGMSPDLAKGSGPTPAEAAFAKKPDLAIKGERILPSECLVVDSLLALRYDIISTARLGSNLDDATCSPAQVKTNTQDIKDRIEGLVLLGFKRHLEAQNIQELEERVLG